MTLLWRLSFILADDSKYVSLPPTKYEATQPNTHLIVHNLC